MKKLYLFGIMFCGLVISSSVCRAEDDIEAKNTYKKELIEACMEEFDSDDEIDISMSFSLKTCRCVADKVLNKYSLAELEAIDEYEGRVEEFAEDMETFGTECALANGSDDINAMMRKSLIEGCMEGMDSHDKDSKIPYSFSLKYCRCSADKMMGKYSVTQLLEIEKYDDKAEKYVEDMENIGKECAREILRNKH